MNRLPHTLVTAPGHDRQRSLGWLAVSWMEHFLKHGRGGMKGQPVVHTDEQTRFIVDCYAVAESGGRLYDRAFFSRPKGADKSGLAARLAMFEACGPCRTLLDENGEPMFAEGGEVYEDPWGLGFRYEYLPGEPLGTPVVDPMIRCLATEKGQTGNVYDTILYNFREEDCLLSHILDHPDDAAKYRITIPGHGVIVPSTAGAASKDGGLETFWIADETHVYVHEELREMYETVERNAEKRRAEGAWGIETTTMYARGEDSIAERTYEDVERILEGKAHSQRLLFDHRYGEISMDELDDVDAVERALNESFGDTAAWFDLRARAEKIADNPRDILNSFRYWFNDKTSVESAWVMSPEWSGCRATDKVVAAGEAIVLGFDGSRGRARGKPDATALIGVRVSDGHVFEVGVWEASEDKSTWDSWAPPVPEIEALLAKVFRQYKVVAMYCDPAAGWSGHVASWEARWGGRVPVKSRRDAPFSWNMGSQIRVQKAIEEVEDAIHNQDLTHDDSWRLTQHVLNTRRRLRKGKLSLSKESDYSSNKIDAAVSMVLAWQARLDALSEGYGKAKTVVYPKRLA